VAEQTIDTDSLGASITIGEVKPALAETSKKPAARTGPKWEADTRERIRAALRKFTKPLADLAARDANEGDTRLLVTDIRCEALG
jgi:hypothetical protein